MRKRFQKKLLTMANYGEYRSIARRSEPQSFPARRAMTITGVRHHDARDRPSARGHGGQAARRGR